MKTIDQTRRRKIAQPRKQSSQAWTLVELIGVLAVAAILFALAIPALLHELDRAAASLESQRLRELSRAIRDQVQRTGTIPDAPGLPALAALVLGCRPSDCAINARGLPRAMIWDPRLQVGPETNRALPFVQTARGSGPPVAARLVIVSSLGESLPAGLTNGASLSADAFDAIWRNWPPEIPSDWEWSGRGEDLRIERCDLADLFAPVTLIHRASDPAQWGIAAGDTSSLSSGSFTSWFLIGTLLSLYGADGQIESLEVIRESQAWVFGGGKWQRSDAWSSPPATPAGRDFAEIAERFELSPPNPAAPAGSQESTLTAMRGLIEAYQNWAAAGFGSPVPAETVAAWQALESITAGLLAAP